MHHNKLRDMNRTLQFYNFIITSNVMYHIPSVMYYRNVYRLESGCKDAIMHNNSTLNARDVVFTWREEN